MVDGQLRHGAKETTADCNEHYTVLSMATGMKADIRIKEYKPHQYANLL